MIEGITVVIPVYNCKEFVRECLLSLADQTFRNWYCVCVDDGSTDGSYEILEGYCRDHPMFASRCRLIRQKNAGPGIARNVGLENVFTKWVMFLDADDMLHPRALELCNECVVRDPEVQAVSFQFSPKITELSDKVKPRIVQDPLRSYCEEQGANMAYSIAVCRLWNMEIVGAIKFQEWRNGEDSAWCMMGLSRVSREVRLDVPLYFYRQNIGGLHDSKGAFDTILQTWRAKVEIAPFFRSYLGVDAWCLLRTNFSFRLWWTLRILRKDGVIAFDRLPTLKRILLLIILF